MFLIKNDVNISHECGLLKDDIVRLRRGFKKILEEQNEKQLDCIENEEGAIVERNLKK